MCASFFYGNNLIKKLENAMLAFFIAFTIALAIFILLPKLIDIEISIVPFNIKVYLIIISRKIQLYKKVNKASVTKKIKKRKMNYRKIFKMFLSWLRNHCIKVKKIDLKLSHYDVSLLAIVNGYVYLINSLLYSNNLDCRIEYRGYLTNDFNITLKINVIFYPLLLILKIE